MSTIDNGGPAFPVSTAQANDGEYGHQSGHSTWQFPGMTLRDYFAGIALGSEHTVGTPKQCAKQCAKQAYEVADEMLKARAAATKDAEVSNG